MKNLSYLIQGYLGMTPKDKGCQNWTEMQSKMEEDINQFIQESSGVFFEKKLKDLFTDENFIENVCLSYRHDFGLMTDLQREQLIFECKEWMRAIENITNTKAKNPENYEYEMFFDDDGPISIHGWYPISTDRIKHPEKIEEYIAKGLLRRI